MTFVPDRRFESLAEAFDFLGDLFTGQSRNPDSGR